MLLDLDLTKIAPFFGVKLAWFEIGGRRGEDLRVHSSATKSGPLSTPEIDENLGTKLFEPFVLSFEYRSHRIGFRVRD